MWLETRRRLPYALAALGFALLLTWIGLAGRVYVRKYADTLRAGTVTAQIATFEAAMLTEKARIATLTPDLPASPTATVEPSATPTASATPGPTGRPTPTRIVVVTPGPTR